MATAAAVWLAGCTSQPPEDTARERPERAASERGAPPDAGNEAYELPDSPFTRKGTVVTAGCSLGARYGAVSVQAWDPETWKVRAERFFALPANAVFGDHTVHSPLVDLCRSHRHTRSSYGSDALEFTTPRIRALFDLGFTRMAVVLQAPDGASTRAGFVRSGADDLGEVEVTGGGDEENAVMAPDGRSVWFTYTDSSGRSRIGSRTIEDGDRLSEVSDEGASSGHDLPLTVTGKPPRALQAEMVRVSPDGRRVTARAPHVFGDIFDAPASSSALSADSARNATLASGCLGVVGWVDDARVLCRTESGSFRTLDAGSGRAAGKPVAAVDPGEGRVAEGMLVSPDGREFVVFGHPPNDRFGDAHEGSYELLLDPDYRVVRIGAGSEPRAVTSNRLSLGTVFLAWL